MNVVPATRELMEQFLGYTPETSVRAFAFVEDGRVHGVVGMTVTTHPFIGFLDLDDKMRGDMRRYARPLVRVVRRLQDHAASRGLPVVVDVDETIPDAVRFIEAMGFVKHNRIYVWH